MAKLWHVAREELRYHLEQGSFYISLALMVLTFVAFGLLPRLREAAAASPLARVETIFSEEETLTAAIGFVDRAAIITYVPEEQAAYLRRFDDEAAAVAALRRGAVEAYYVIPADYLESGKVTHHSDAPQLVTAGDATIRQLLRQNLFHTLSDPHLAARLEEPVVLVRRGPPPAYLGFLPSDLELERLAAALLVGGLFAYLLNMGGVLLLRALQREVEWRVLEMMISAVRPWQLIGGKLLGLSLLTLAQAGLILLAGLLVYGRATTQIGQVTLPPGVLALSLPYLLLGYLAYSAAMLNIAVVWPTLSESLQLQMLLRLLALSPLLGGLFILPDANGPAAVALSLTPFTSPLLMPFRLLLTRIPAWEYAAGLALLLLWSWLLFWLSARLFRANSLLTGRAPSLATLWGALRG